jgi:hypothetical protein
MKFAVAVLAVLVLVHGAAFAADPTPEETTCQSDSDCALVQTGCSSCCPTFDLNDVTAVNAEHVKKYERPDVCSAEHIRACGVPECGMMPTPYPVAVCQQGVCTKGMHPAPLRPAPPSP